MTTTMRRLPVRRSGLLLTEAETGSVVIDPDDGTTHMLNAPARAIWELCDGTTTIDELVSAICQVFSVPHGVALSDVSAALSELEDAGLVSWSSHDLQGG